MKGKVVLLGLALGVLVSTQAFAQSDLGLKQVGVAIGYVSPEDIDGTFTFGALMNWGTITPRIELESRIDYWSHSEEQFGAEASVSDLTLGARGKYFFEVAHPTLRPFAGAGLGLHLLHAKVTIPAFGGFPEQTAEDSETRLGLDIGGGVVTAISPQLDFMGELWYGIVSDVSQLQLRVGMGYKLGS
jgi:opacity protein-like surface antigen